MVVRAKKTVKAKRKVAAAPRKAAKAKKKAVPRKGDAKGSSRMNPPTTKTTTKTTPNTAPVVNPAPQAYNMSAFQVEGVNDKALFTLKLHRGEGMALLAMNWKDNKQPPPEFVGFAIEYKEPGGDRFYALKNRLGCMDKDG